MVPNWVRYMLIELTRDKNTGAQHYHHIAEGCFAGIWTNGDSMINWNGMNYVPQRLGLRARVHNWLVGI